MNKLESIFVFFWQLLLMGVPVFSFGQGNGCLGAETIGSLPYLSPDIGDPGVLNSCAGNAFTANDAYGNVFLDGGDFTFQFTPSQTGCIEAQLLVDNSQINPSDFASFYLFKGCPGGNTSFVVDQSLIPLTGKALQEIYYLEKDTVYYIAISSKSSCFDFQLSLTGHPTGCNVGVGKNPRKALEITSLPFNKAFVEFDSYTEVTSFLNQGNSSIHSNFPEYFLKMNFESSKCVLFSLMRSDYYKLIIYKGSLDNGMDGTLVYNSGPSQGNFLDGSFQFEAGEKYYLIIEKTGDYFDPEIGFDTPYPTLRIEEVSQIGEDCPRAIPLIPDEILLYQSTMCLGQDYFEPQLGNTTYPLGDDIVYEFEIADSSCVTLNLLAIKGNVSVYLGEGCPAEGNPILASGDNFDGWNYVFLQQVLPPGKYFIVVSNANDFNTILFHIILGIEPVDRFIGVNCEEPYQLSNGIILSDITTKCKNQDFSSSDFPGINEQRGEDVVLQFTLENPACVNFLVNKMSPHEQISIYVMDACPNPSANILLYANNGAGWSEIDEGVNLEAGSYYLVICSKEVGAYNQFDVLMSFSDFVLNTSNCETPNEINTFPTLGYHVNTACHFATIPLSQLCSNWYDPVEEYFIRIPSVGLECLEVIGRDFTNVGNMTLYSGCPLNVGSNCLANVWCPDQFCDSIRMEYRLSDPGDYYLVISALRKDEPVVVDLDIFKTPESGCQSCNNNRCNSCFDLGFDDMQMTRWRGYYGKVDDPKQTVDFLDLGVNEKKDGSHTIMNKGRYDPLIPQLPATSPNGSDFAFRLGNSKSRRGGEVMEVDFIPTPENNGLIYWYAVVFEDPEHLPEDQPYFQIALFDSLGVEIECAHYEVRPKENIEGFEFDPDRWIRWKNWTPVYIPLNHLVGEKLTLQFVNLDCNLGDHFGYSYFDLECSSMDLSQADTLNCNAWEGDSVLISAPIGFETYAWNTGDSTASIYVKNAGSYSVDLTTVSGCETTLSTDILERGGVDFNTQIIQNCLDTAVTIISQNSIVGGGGVKKDTWTLPNGVELESADTIHYPIIDSQPLVFQFYMEGESGCFLDTIITILPNPKRYSGGLPDSIQVCEGDSVGLNIASTDFSIQWDGVLGASNDTLIYNNSVGLEQNGGVFLEVFMDTCVAFRDSTILVIGNMPQPQIVGPDTICISQNAFIKGIPNSPDPYVSYWNGVSALSEDIYPTVSGTYSYTVSTNLCTARTEKIVKVDFPPLFSTTFPMDICEGDSAFVKLKLEKGDTIFWKDDYPLPYRYWKTTDKLRYTVSQGSCLIDSFIQISVFEKPTLQLREDTIICPYDEVEVTIVDSNLAMEVIWKDGYEEVNRWVSSPGEYVAVAKNGSCFSLDTFNLVTFPNQTLKPIFEICPDTVNFFNPLDHLFDYYWVPEHDKIPRLMEIGERLEYVGISEEGCSVLMSTVAMLDNYCEQAIYVPNSFSPNGDGINDEFYPVHYKGEILLFQIFTRWGELIFETQTNERWNGNFNDGSPCKLDVYAWRVLYRDRYKHPKEFMGTCTLLR